MPDNQQLLAEYAATGSEAAFRDLVSRYINLVFSTARRLVGGDAHLAQDVTQMVFITLAARGRQLSPGVMLGGWLYQHTYHIATKVMRSERRRLLRERQAVEMNTLHQDPGEHLRAIAPMLDEAITRLPRDDRAAIVLRFFEQRDFRSVGEALGVQEDAARMRVNRALEKLQVVLRRRGAAATVPALGAALAAGAVTAAPAGLAATISVAALAGATTSGGTALAFLKLMAASPVKSGLATLVLLGAVATAVQHYRATAPRENALSQKGALRVNADPAGNSGRQAAAAAALVPRRPVPRGTMARTAPLPAEPVPGGSLYALFTNQSAVLTLEQVGPYLDANRRSPASLLAAFRTTGDGTLLDEAKRNFPEDPRVAFEAALEKGAAAGERRRWLDAFKQSAPDNSLADYLSAATHFKAGEADQAVQDLIAASAKTAFQDYTLDRVQDDQEAYRAAGYPVADAEFVANTHLVLPQLVEMRDLAGSLLDLARAYEQAGDDTSRAAALQMEINLGRRYQDTAPGQTLISQLVGVSIERMALGAMDPAGRLDNDGLTVQDRLDQLTRLKTGIKDLATQAEGIFPTLTDQDWISYHSRMSAYGEEPALRWLVDRYGRN